MTILTHNLLISNKEYLILTSDSLGVNLNTKMSHFQRKSEYSIEKSFALALYGDIVLVNEKNKDKFLVLDKVYEKFKLEGESIINSLIEETLGKNLDAIKQNWNVGVFGIFLDKFGNQKFFTSKFWINKNFLIRKPRFNKKYSVHKISKNKCVGIYSNLLKKWPNGDFIDKKDEKLIKKTFKTLLTKIDNKKDHVIISNVINSYYQYLQKHIKARFFEYPIQIYILDKRDIKMYKIDRSYDILFEG